MVRISVPATAFSPVSSSGSRARLHSKSQVHSNMQSRNCASCISSRMHSSSAAHSDQLNSESRVEPHDQKKYYRVNDSLISSGRVLKNTGTAILGATMLAITGIATRFLGPLFNSFARA